MAISADIRPFEVTHRGVLAIAVPMTFAFLSTPLLGVVNTAVIGSLGEPALLGGIAVGAIVFDIVFTTFNFLRSGTTGFTAQAHGAGDAAETQAMFWRGIILAAILGAAVLVLHRLILALALGLIGGSDAVREATATYYDIRVLATPFALANYVILGWLIGLGRPGLGLLLQTVLNGLNAVLSIIFVSHLEWGVAGVAWAAFLAELTTMAIGLPLAMALMDKARRPSRVRILDRAAFRRLAAVNGDIMIRSFALLFAFAFFTAQSAKGGDVVLAANQILLTLFFVGSYFLDGLATAAEQMAGRAVGAHYRPAFERSLSLSIGWGFAIAAAASAVLWFGGPWIIAAMTASEEVRAVARLYLVYAALTPLVGTLAFQMDGFFIGATWSSDMRNMMLLSLAVYVAAWWLLTPSLGIDGLWLALLVFLGIRGATLYWRCRVRMVTAFP